MASEKIAAMIEEVKTLSVLELAELVHALEEDLRCFRCRCRCCCSRCRLLLLPLRKRRPSSTSS